MNSVAATVTSVTTFVEIFTVTGTVTPLFNDIITLSTAITYITTPCTFIAPLALVGSFGTTHTTNVMVVISPASPTTSSTISTPIITSTTTTPLSIIPTLPIITSTTTTSLPIITSTTTTSLPIITPTITTSPTITSLTTKATSSPKYTPTTKPTKSTGISKGEVTGIGFACLIFGGLIAALLVWLWLRNRRTLATQDAVGDFRHPSNVNTTSRSKYPSIAMTSIPPSFATVGLESRLPQPLPEDTIAKDIYNIRTAIKNHAYNYYLKNGNTSMGGTTGAKASLLGAKAPIQSKRLASLLSEPKTRTEAIRFLLAWTILGRMEHTAGPEKGLLPPDLAECMRSMKMAEKDTDSHVILLSKWRQLSACLLRPSRDSITPDDPRNKNIRLLVSEVDEVLRPLASSRSTDKDRLQNLEAIVQRAARVGYMLFSQPTTWAFQWDVYQLQQGMKKNEGLCLWPALICVADERGIRLAEGKVFGERDVASFSS